MSKDLKAKIAIIGAVLLVVLSFIAGCQAGRGTKTPPPPADTIRIHTIDTVTLVRPRDTVTRIVWKPYPVAVTDTMFVIRHTTDSIFITLPYQYKHFSMRDTLDVWYSGIDPRLDSIAIYNHQTTEIIREQYEVTKMQRLTIDLGVGAMYAEKRVNPYLFGEMRYNAPKLTVGVFGAVTHEGKWGAGANVSWRCTLYK